MAAKAKSELNQRIIAALDIPAVYQSFGLRLDRSEPNGKGWIQCYAMEVRDSGQAESHASAAIHSTTGRYKDLGGNGESLSLFDFAVKYGGMSDFKAARAELAKRAGVKLSPGKEPAKPEDKLKFLNWNDNLAALWCGRFYPQISVEGMKLMGARMAGYPNNPEKGFCGDYIVFAFPVYGSKLLDEDPIAWVIMQSNGHPLPVWEKDGTIKDTVTKKSIGPTGGGLMGAHGCSRIGNAAMYVVFSVEGPTDAMALLSIIPEDKRDHYLVVCNAAGASENLKSSVAHHFAAQQVVIIRDADATGEAGAATWMQSIKLHSPASLCQVHLPYQVVEKKGADLRQWIGEGHTFDELLEMVTAASPVELLPLPVTVSKLVEEVTEAEVAPPPAPTSVVDKLVDQMTDLQIMRKIGIEVLGELDNAKEIKVFSLYHRKIATISDASKLSYQHLIQIGGPPTSRNVTCTNEPVEDMVSLIQVKDAISFLAGYHRLDSEHGAGIGTWGGRNGANNDDGSVVLVGCGEASRYDKDGTFERVLHPRCGSRLLDFSSAQCWYSHDKLERSLAALDNKSATALVDETVRLFEKWRWLKQTESPIVVVGLVLATWVQTLWNWRPQVSIIGGTKSGKSTLFEALGGLFGSLAFSSSKSTAAGVRQGIGNSAKAVLIDEFEESKHRAEVFEMIRAAGSGSTIAVGSADQRGRKFVLRHIVWTAAIESGQQRAPDLNRFIRLELLPPTTENEGRLKLPPAEDLHDLGQRLLAAAIKYSARAKELAVYLKARRFPGIDSRLVECYSVPAAILSAIEGMGNEDAEGTLRSILVSLDMEEPPSDERDLLQAILSAVVRGREEQSVAQLIERVRNHECGGIPEQSLARVGIRVEHDMLIIAPDAACLNLLSRTPWQSQKIDQILARLPDAQRQRLRIGGRRCRCITIPMAWFAAEFLGANSAQGTF